ncbi:pantoate--beta-alanine ligase [Pseudactinotalea sp. Z1748]|uniref:pantoate--beta-alanine ligase n=1 Tax=Pseudactinotalea sp. Z1748 TaxID=3413027 RepID=UPI003C7E56C2
MNERPGRLGVGVVGAGRVGAVLGSALRAAGHAVVGLSASSTASRDRAEAMLPGVPVLGVEEVVERSELVLLTVPDDVLADLVSGLATLERFVPGQLVVHTAGRYGTDVLAPAMQRGAIPLAIHPAMTFTGTSMDLSRLVGAPFAVTAPGPVLPIAQALVVEMGGEPVALPETSRALYHAALAHGANHLVTLTAQAIRVLGAAGIEDGGAMLRPLLSAALDGALRAGDGALTGPVARGDGGTVAEHLETLARLDAEGTSADVLPTYRTLARATTQRALATGRIRTDQAQALMDVLAGAGPNAAGPGEPAPGPTTTARAGASSSGPLLVHSVTDLRTHLDALGPDVRRAAVFTMGALHAGHLSLIRTARDLADHVTVTIFINPLQFDRAEDLATYPSTLDADLERLRELGGVDLVFAPAVEEMYPGGVPQVRVQAGEMGERLEGASRPGHFDGMLTVVHKLMSLTRADVTVFGRKDAQQLALVRQMVRDLDLDVQVVAGDTVRENDGLALSSRNVNLSPAERAEALRLSGALRAAQRAAEQGAPAGEVLGAAEQVLAEAAPDVVDLDYLELVDPVTMRPHRTGTGAALLVVAARVGRTRLIDNTEIALRPRS